MSGEADLDMSRSRNNGAEWSSIELKEEYMGKLLFLPCWKPQGRLSGGQDGEHLFPGV